jgi:fermentation-respiration switch protein FrsA (DUF1100 family)/flagellar basal body-associated protein FliL
MKMGKKGVVFLFVFSFLIALTGITYASWVYIPYDQMIGEADVIFIGQVEAVTFNRLRTEHITYNLCKVQPLYFLKGEYQGNTIHVGTPNRNTSLHFTLGQRGSQVLLILQGEGKAFIPRTPQGVIEVALKQAYSDNQGIISGEELLQVLSINDGKLSDEERVVIQDYIRSLDKINIVQSSASTRLSLPILLSIGVVIILLAVLSMICWRFSNRIINIKTSSTEEIIKVDTDDGISSLDWFESLYKEQHWIPSTYGYSLYAEYIPVEGPSKGSMIFSHGVTVSHITSIKYMRIFYEQGYNCLVYDHRRHGKSGGKYTSYGYYEKFDLQTVVDWLEHTKGFHGKLGIHGESMGAAITLLYAGMGGKADFYIADCPYSTILDQLLYRMKVEYNIQFVPLMHLVAWVVLLRAGFRLSDVNCLEAVKKADKPILFIHGSEDDYVPTHMGKALYNAKPEPKELYLVPGAAHAKALATDPENYSRVVFEFIDRYVHDER